MCLSIYLIIAVGLERYLAVCRPHHYREMQAGQAGVSALAINDFPPIRTENLLRKCFVVLTNWHTERCSTP